MKKIIFGTALAAVLTAVPAYAQVAATPSPPANAIAEESPKQKFTQTMKDFDQRMGALMKDLDASRGKLDDLTKQTPDKRRAEFEAYRERVREFGRMLTENAPIRQSIDRFDSWLAAQIARLNNSRETMGRDFVEKRIQQYQGMRKNVTSARELVDSGSSQANSLLKELTMAELRAIELIAAEEAEEAVKQLTDAVQNINQTLNKFREKVREAGQFEAGS